MYCLLKTNHSINQYVMECIEYGFNLGKPPSQHIRVYNTADANFSSLMTPISYGILRGTGEIFNQQRKAEKDYWEIDLGYFNPSHFSGYYRISKNGTRAKYNKAIADKLPSDRWDALNINISSWKTGGEYILFCPPTDEVRAFYRIPDQWEKQTLTVLRETGYPIKIREKNSINNFPLSVDLQDAVCLVAYNSNTMIEALVAGVPVIGFSEDIYNWNNLKPKDIGKKDLTTFDRYSLFKFLSYCQFTLAEFSTGEAWKITGMVQDGSE